MKIMAMGGFCPGVKLAYDRVLRANKERSNKQVVLIGELVHNEDVLSRLEKEGVVTVGSIDDLANIETDKDILPVIRAHGTTVEEENRLKRWLIQKYGTPEPAYLDLTCPLVKRVHKVAKKFSDQGYRVVIFGKKDHPEVEGIASRAENGFVVYEKPDKVNAGDFKEREHVGVVAQTTSEVEKYDVLAQRLEEIGLEADVVDTYCDATRHNQSGIKTLAKWADLIIVVGGLKSSNTKKLYDICSKRITAYKIENSDGLRKEWFEGKDRIGIAAGASTPPWVVDDVKREIKRYEE